MWNKISEFFQQEDGFLDAVHFAYMGCVIMFVSLGTFLTIYHAKFPEVPGTFLATISFFVSAKLIQRPMENKAVRDANEPPKPPGA